MKPRQIKISQDPVSTNMADNLIESLLGEKVPTSHTDNVEVGTRETYQLPVQVGQAGEPLSKGDKPWIVGTFSPGVATDQNHPKGHNGVDLKAVRGTPVHPIASGVVKDVGTAGISGNFVMCLHEDGHVQSFYGHLDSIKASKGQAVTQSSIIGTVGDTGNAKGRGAHLHYEVKVNSSLVNPLSIPGKPVGSLTKKASLLNYIQKTANNFYLLSLASDKKFALYGKILTTLSPSEVERLLPSLGFPVMPPDLSTPSLAASWQNKECHGCKENGFPGTPGEINLLGEPACKDCVLTELARANFGESVF